VEFKEQQCSPGNVQVYVDAVFGRDPEEVCLAGAREEIAISNKARKQITSFWSRYLPAEQRASWSLFLLGLSGPSLL